MSSQKNEKWSHRFIIAAVIQSILAAIWTIPIVLPWIKPSVAMVMAAGSAGTWFTVGYILYIIVGVLGNAAIGLIYQHFETVEGKVVSGITNALAWLQLILFNLGVMAATWSLMIAGYFGEADLLPPAVGGKGMTEGQVHVLLLARFINPVGTFVIITVLGVIIGAIVFLSISLKD